VEPFTIDHFRDWVGKLTLDNGQKFKLEPFQERFAEDVFAGVPECWFILPEGNGKTTLIAALGLYHAKFTPDAWVTVAASSRDQAKIAYRQAKGFVNRGGAWGFRCFDGYRRIDNKSMGSQIEVFAADERTGDGVIPTLCILDELHRHRSLDLYETWRGKLGKRNGQLVTISTAGEPGSEFEETRERIRQTAETVEKEETFTRAFHPQLVLHEWSVPEDGDVEDMELVARANPFSGVTPESLTAKFSTPSMTVQHWRRFTCNLPTRSFAAAITEAEWHGATTREEIPAGEPRWVGLDVAWKWDTTAIVPFWAKNQEYRLFGRPTILTPPRDGTSLDPNLVERALIREHERGPIHTVVMDTSKAEQLAEWISQELGATVIDRGQTNSSRPWTTSGSWRRCGTAGFKHPGDPEFNRHVLNAVTRVLPQGDARFDRPHQSRLGGEQDRRVIDALTAAAMVHSTYVGDLAVEDRPAWGPAEVVYP
jgi:phage terminase large subunit-like protein